jgi:hypothetical protein
MSTEETQEASDTPPSIEPNTGDTDYKVGYRRPPKQTRFQPGQSGNPKGRPPGSSNHKSTVARVINEKVPVREGDKTRKMTKLEALVQSHAVKGIKGDAKSANVVIGLMVRMGLLGDQEDEAVALSPDDDAIFKDYLRRKGYSRVDDDKVGSEEP